MSKNYKKFSFTLDSLVKRDGSISMNEIKDITISKEL